MQDIIILAVKKGTDGCSLCRRILVNNIRELTNCEDSFSIGKIEDLDSFVMSIIPDELKGEKIVDIVNYKEIKWFYFFCLDNMEDYNIIISRDISSPYLNILRIFNDDNNLIIKQSNDWIV